MPVDEGQIRPYDPSAFRPPETATQDEGGQTTLTDQDGNPLPSFDERHREDFEGLLFLGALSKDFTWLGHQFVIRTLTQGEYLIVPMLMKKWAGSIGEAKAYATAMAAMATVSVDGQELPVPIGDGEGEFAWAFQRFQYIQTHWFPYVIDKVYSEFLALEAKVEEVIAAMEKASGSTESTPGLSADSAEPTDKDS